MKKITLDQLKRLKACKEQVSQFESLFGKSRGFRSEAAAVRVARKHAQVFDWDWAARQLISDSAYLEYKRVRITALEEYARVTAAALQEYARSQPSVLDYHEESPAYAEYIRVQSPAYAEYIRAITPAENEYKRVEAEAFARAWWKDTE